MSRSVLLLLLLLGAACVAAPPHPAARAPLDSIQFARGGCYRNDCAAYRLVVRADGSAEWLGEEWARPLGPARAQLPPGVWRDLSARVLTVGLDTLEDVYPATDPAAPRAEIRAFPAGWPPRSVVSVGGSGPVRLEGLFAHLDSLAASLGWRAAAPE